MSTMRLGGTAIVMEQFDPEARARVHRAVPRHAQPVGADDVRAHAEAARRRARHVRPVVAEGRDPRGGAVPGRGEAQDDRVVGPDHRRVLRRDRRHGRDVHQQRPTGSRTPARSASRCSRRSTSSTTTATSCRPARSAPCGSSRRRTGPASSTTRTRRRRATRSTTAGLVDRRRHGLPRRRRLPLPHRPPHVHDRVGRREHLSAGSRERCSSTTRRSTTSRCSASPTRRWASVCTASCSRSTGTTPDPSSNASCSRTAASTSRTTSARRPIDFDRELPREQTGKLYKRLLRDRYWGDKTSRIV